MKDDYKKLSHEWGSKRRKEDSRSAKSTLKKPTKEELAELVPDFEAACPHPARDGRHEVYLKSDGTQFCRACGARKAK